MAYAYETLTDDVKRSLVNRRIQEMEQQHFEHDLTATMLEAETAPDAKVMAEEARRTQVALERGIASAKKLRSTMPAPAPPPPVVPPVPPVRP